MHVNEKLYLYTEDSVPCEADITDELGKGGSADVYRVVIRGVTGTLRKIRNDNDLSVYELVKEIGSQNNELKGVFPTFNILHDQSNLTYIFSSDPKLKTFEQLCTDAKSDDEDFFVAQIISALKNLVVVVNVMHTSGILHRDISPSNFGFRLIEGNILTETISLFDVGSFAKIGNLTEEIVGTPGFCDSVTSPQDTRSDIYSISACLFYALTGETFNPIDYDELENFVRQRSLLTRCKNLHPTMPAIIVNILKKCLAPHSLRCQDCAELVKDFKTAEYYALPANLSKMKNWEEVRKFFFAKPADSKDYRLAILYHLNAQPLFTFAKDEFKIFVAGFGKYSQAFLDVALSLAQLPGKKLAVHIITDDNLDVETYLKERPLLADFFTINGNHQPADKESYGEIYFHVANIFKDNPFKNFQPNYIFCSLGSDNKNLEVVNFLQNHLSNPSACLLNYVWSEDSPPVTTETVKPLEINRDVDEETIAEIECAAFNVHLSWEKNLCVDLSKVKSQFLQSYNHLSCLLVAVHLRYKLHSAGINLDDTPLNIGENFENLIENPANKDIFENLIHSEHKRWVVEKLVLGYKPRRVTECVDIENKDKRKKTHTCLIRSLPNRKLSAINPSQWDSMTFQQLSQYDELDRMSIKLHTFYSYLANQAKQQNILNSPEIYDLRDLISKDDEALLCFNEWFEIVCQLWSGNNRNVYRYDNLKKCSHSGDKEFAGKNQRYLLEKIS